MGRILFWAVSVGSPAFLLWLIAGPPVLTGGAGWGFPFAVVLAVPLFTVAFLLMMALIFSNRRTRLQREVSAVIGVPFVVLGACALAAPMFVSDIGAQSFASEVFGIGTEGSQQVSDALSDVGRVAFGVVILAAIWDIVRYRRLSAQAPPASGILGQ